jgi:hypothetical protein
MSGKHGLYIIRNFGGNKNETGVEVHGQFDSDSSGV